ncbi:MAG TPA: DUF1579 family protein, partial [Pirellulaceae bacterium]
MKKWMSGLVVVLLAGIPSVVVSQEAPADHAAMQKMWDEFGKPGPEHEMFKHHVGTWKTVTVDYMADPSKPESSEGKAEFKLVMDGRFLIQHFSGTSQGKTFEGIGMSAYDKSKKKYTGTWVDTMSTAIMTTEGTYDPAK